MKLDRFLSFITGVLLSFALSFSGVLALADGFSWLLPNDSTILPPDVATLLFWCLGGALMVNLLFTLFRSSWLLLLCPLALTGLWVWGNAAKSFSDLVYLISRQYDLAYGWGVFHLGQLPPDSPAPEGALILLILLIVFSVSYVVCLRKRLIFALVPILLPMVLCHVIRGTTPSASFLLPWLWSMLMLLITQGVRRKDERNANRLTLYASLPTLLALLLLFTLLPLEGYTGKERADLLWSELRTRFNQEIQELSPGGSSGSNTVRLDTLGRRFKSNATFMTVSGNADSIVYLRGHAYDTYTGLSFTDSGNNYDLPWPTAFAEEDYRLHVKTKSPEPVLYIPYLSDGIVEGINVQNNTNHLLEYDHIVWIPQPAGDFIWNEYAFSALCDLPGDTLGWSQTLLEENGLLQSNARLTAAAIGQFVRSSAAYRLTPSRMNGDEEDFVRWFLTDAEAGYCSHFAASATVLLRAAGIPARYVTGYLVDLCDTESVRVTNDNAHAWVEYWTQFDGWQILDATPSAEEEVETVEPLPSPDSAPAPLTPTLPDVPSSNNPVDSPGLPTRIPGFETTDGPVDLHLFGIIMKWLLWITIPILLLLLVWRIRIFFVTRRLRCGDPNQRALAIFSHAIRFGHALGKRPPVAVVKLAQKARFSQHILKEEEIVVLSDYLISLREAARKCPFCKRIYLRLILALY